MRPIRVYTQQELTLQPDVPGAKRWAVGLTQSMLTYFEMEPNTVFPEHSHEAEQITLVLEGELTFTYANQEVTLHPGDVIAIPGHVPHAAATQAGACKAVDAWSPVRGEFLNK